MSDISRTVIKLGGSVLIDRSLRGELIAEIMALRREGLALILVHGGGKQIASMLSQLGVQSNFHDGLRITDKAARDVVQMVLAGQVGKDLVAELARSGISAVSIAGGDGMSFIAEKMNADDGFDLGFVGRIVKTDPALVDAVIAAGMLPVISCLALGRDDFEYYNINGDQMAAAVAAGCGADTLIFVTDVGGVMNSNGNLIPELDRRGIDELLDTGVATGGMRPKLRACREALDAGVKNILIVGAHGKGKNNDWLLHAVKTGDVQGTQLMK